MDSMKKDVNYGVLTFFITLYPFFVFPWNVYFITLTKLGYLLLFIITLWSVFLLQWTRAKRPVFVTKSNGEKFALLFFFLISLSTIFARNPSISLFGEYSKYQGLLAWTAYITIFLFFYHQIPISKQVKTVQLIVFASFFCALYGIFQWHFLLDDLIGKGNKVKYGNWAFFDNPNHFGSYLVIMMILAMTLYLLREKR